MTASRCRLLAHAAGGVALSLWGEPDAEPTAVQLDLHDNDGPPAAPVMVQAEREEVFSLLDECNVIIDINIVHMI